MRKTRILITICMFAIGSMTLLSGCKKYDEGGKVKKAEQNILGEWDMERAFKNGDPVFNIEDNIQIGEVTEDWWFFENGDVATENGDETLVGTWELTNGGLSIEISITEPSSLSSNYTYSILQLESQDMVWEHILGEDVYRYEFKLSSKETPSSIDEL